MHSVMRDERSMSVLCAGVAGDETASCHPDKQEALRALRRCENSIRRAVEINGGRLVKRNGNKVMAFFGNNVAALQSAIEMQHRVADYPSSSDVSIGVRVGVCAGHLYKEESYFPSEGTNPAVSLSVASGPGSILLSIPKRVEFSPWLPLVAANVPDLALSCGNRQLGVFQVPWQKHSPVALKIALLQLQKGVDELCLRFKGRELVLDGNQPTLKIGRRMDCEFQLQDSRTSRVHGTIERRGDHFVFVDRSTNGTFVTLEDQMEFVVHRTELAVHGHGQFSLGASSSAEGVEVVQFETSRFS